MDFNDSPEEATFRAEARAWAPMACIIAAMSSSVGRYPSDLSWTPGVNELSIRVPNMPN